MPSTTKVILSGEELTLVTNTEWILAKQRIMQNISVVFSDFIPVIDDEIMPFLREHSTSYPPKIAKGENYLGLPYLMMDYPRLFTPDDTCSVRTMFWWGRYISITLHLAGKSYDRLTPGIKRKSPGLLKEFFIQVDEDPWQHQVMAPYYLPISGEEIKEGKFLKLALKLDITNIKMAPEFLQSGYKKIGGLLN